MRERLRQLGGNLEIRSGTTGTTVLATLPIRKPMPIEEQKSGAA